MKATLAALAGRMSFADTVPHTPPALTPSRIKTELLSGLTVALALVPEAVAFAFVAGVHPLVGLYAAFIVGLITAVMGGRPGMISGATGALLDTLHGGTDRGRFGSALAVIGDARKKLYLILADED